MGQGKLNRYIILESVLMLFAKSVKMSKMQLAEVGAFLVETQCICLYAFVSVSLACDYLPVCLCVCLCVCLSVCVSVSLIFHLSACCVYVHEWKELASQNNERTNGMLGITENTLIYRE